MSHSLYLPDVGPTLNEWYAGLHWSKRKALADYWHLLVLKWVRKYDVQPVPPPVHLAMDFYFGPGRRAYDASNCAATAKLIEDGLVHAKILKGDGPTHVRTIALTTHPQAEKTYTMVQIIGVKR